MSLIEFCNKKIDAPDLKQTTRGLHMCYGIASSLLAVITNFVGFGKLPIDIATTGDDMAAIYRTISDAYTAMADAKKVGYLVHPEKTIYSGFGYVLGEEIYFRGGKKSTQKFPYFRMKMLYPDSGKDSWHIMAKSFSLLYPLLPKVIADKIFSVIWKTNYWSYKKLLSNNVPIFGELGLFPSDYGDNPIIYYRKSCENGSDECFKLYAPHMVPRAQRLYNSLKIAKDLGEKESWYLPFNVGEPDKNSHVYCCPKPYTDKEYIEATSSFESEYLYDALPKTKVAPLLVDQVIRRHTKIYDKDGGTGYFRLSEAGFFSSIPQMYNGKLPIPEEKRISFKNVRWESPVVYVDYANYLYHIDKKGITGPDILIPKILALPSMKKARTIIIIHDKNIGSEMACKLKGQTIIRWGPRKSSNDSADDLIVRSVWKDAIPGRSVKVLTMDAGISARLKKSNSIVCKFNGKVLNPRRTTKRKKKDGKRALLNHNGR